MNKIEPKDLNQFYRDHQARMDITPDVDENNVTALIGSSGYGKYTFLKSINRIKDLIPSVTINGKVNLDRFDFYNDINGNELGKRVGP